MISLFVSESIIAALINQEFEDLLNEYEWEQKHKKEIEDMHYLQNLRKIMRDAYEQGDNEKFDSLWSFYSDIYKDIYNVRPHRFF